MTNLNRKLLTLYLALGIVFFIAVIYLFVKNEILPGINSNVSHKVRLTSVRFIKNDYFSQKLLDSSRNTDEGSVPYNLFREKRQCNLLLVNEADNATYAQSTSFFISLFKPPFSVGFFDDALIPQTTLNDKFRLDLQEVEKTIVTFEVTKLNELLEINKKSDTVTEEKTIKLSSSDKRIVLFLIFTID